jgi:hypothetical protein
LAASLARAETASIERTPILGVLIDDGSAMPGAALLRVWLAATRDRLALHPLSVLLDRRGWELARRLGLRPAQLLFAFRLGRSAPPPFSGRRAVERFTRLCG